MSKQKLRTLVGRLATREGVTGTGLEGVELYRLSAPWKRTPAIYTPSVCFNVSGVKRVFANGRVYLYDENHFVCCTIPLPVEAEIPTATERKPLLGVSIALDELLLAELAVMAQADQAQFERPPDEGILVGSWNDALSEALLRLLQLIGNPSAMKALGAGRLREVYFALLSGEFGSLLRRRFAGANDIADTIRYVRENLAKPVTIEQLARRAGMSRAAFHRKFKQTTTLSPVQFIKSLRLSAASMFLATGMRASEAALQVGYVSSSQFSREFRRQFGKSPREWNLAHDFQHGNPAGESAR